MDPTALIRRKLSADENCLICLEASTIKENGLKSARYLALVERYKDHGIFVYNSSRIPCLDPSDLTLETVLPIEKDLKCTSANNMELLIRGSRGSLKVELVKGPQADRFLVELHKCREALLRSNGLPSSFSWIEKYTTQGSKPPGNPFSNDVFNPFLPPNQVSPANSDSTNGGSIKVVDDYFGEKLPENKLQPSISTDSIESWATTSTEIERQISGQTIARQISLDLPSPILARETDGKRYMLERESEYVNTKTVRVLCASWNVNGQAPVESLAPWLRNMEQPPDIYAVGFQELDLSKEAFIFTESQREQEWKDFVESSLHLSQSYRKVKLIRLVGIMLIVYVKKDLFKHVTLLDSDSVPTGIMGIMGNKGGVSIRFTIHNTSFCFVNSHLAAHQDEFERRNQDYCDINSKTRFKTFVPPMTISEHDAIFWIGDLNYRLTDIDIETVKTFIGQKQYEKLLLHDQLLQQIKARSNIYKGYSEHKITFRPTYKYDPGSDNWDSSEKNRIPAWCDRILYKGSGINPQNYNSHEQLKVSDHKPVSCSFNVEVKVIDPVRYKKVYEDVMKKLDREENDILPQVKLDVTEFHFPDVKFMEAQAKILTIANIGRSSVTFSFINKLDDDRYSKPWITLDPCQSTIKSGLSCEVEIQVLVSKSEAGKLNSGEDTLDDILVLSLAGGKDIFVPITGTYIPSTFGSSLEALIQMQGPITKVPVAQLIDLETPGSLLKHDETDAPPIPIPKELWRLIDHLYRNGMRQNDIFRMSGLHSEVQRIRDCLDTGVPKEIPGSIHSVAEAMLIFLQALPEPVIPCKFYEQCLEVARNFPEAKELLQQISEYHRNVFKYLCAFLRELLKQSPYNGLNKEFLGSLFGGIFLRPPGSNSDSPARPKDVKKRTEFVTLFLTNEYDD